MGLGSLQETGEERAGLGIPMGARAGRNKNEFCNIVQLFIIKGVIIEKAHRGRNL